MTFCMNYFCRDPRDVLPPTPDGDTNMDKSLQPVKRNPKDALPSPPDDQGKAATIAKFLNVKILQIYY